MVRFFDILFSLLGIILLSPLFLVVALLIMFDSKGGVFYLQPRVGRDNQDFILVKFRSMSVGADQKGGLTVGASDNRITKMGLVLRKYKLDELPQLLNIIKGEMSLVGPRPEIRKYVDLYTPGQRKVLGVKPGLTDYASIAFFRENDILGRASDPEKTYIEVIMPEKIRLNMHFIDHPTISSYFSVLGKTILRWVRGDRK